MTKTRPARIVPLALLALASVMSAAPTNTSVAAVVSGRVTRLDGTTPIAGATVLALREGVLVAGSATWAANGQFLIQGLPPESDDVQAGREGFVSEGQN